MNKKRFKDTGLTTTQREVLDMLTKEYETPRKVAIRRGKSVRAVYKTIKILQRKGYLTVGFTRFTKKQTTSPVNPPLSLKNGIRLHGQEFNIKIINKTSSYDKLSNTKNHMFIDNNTVRLYNDSIEVYAHPLLYFMGEDEQRAYSLSIQYWNKLFNQLENRLNIIIIKGENTRIKQVNAHYAEINNGIAKDCNNKKIKVGIYAKEDGKLWFKIDNSWNLNEAETVHPSTGKHDMHCFKLFLNDIRDANPPLPSQLSSAILGNSEGIKGLIDVQNYHAANIKLHIKAIQEMSNNLNRLTTILDKMEKNGGR